MNYFDQQERKIKKARNYLLDVSAKCYFARSRFDKSNKEASWTLKEIGQLASEYARKIGEGT